MNVISWRDIEGWAGETVTVTNSKFRKRGNSSHEKKDRADKQCKFCNQNNHIISECKIYKQRCSQRRIRGWLNIPIALIAAGAKIKNQSELFNKFLETASSYKYSKFRGSTMSCHLPARRRSWPGGQADKTGLQARCGGIKRQQLWCCRNHFGPGQGTQGG